MLEPASEPGSLAVEPAPPAAAVAPLLVHIGLHKTGSTWLQSKLFNEAQFGFQTPVGEPRHKLVEDIVLPHELLYDPAHVAREYERHCRSAGEQGLTLVLSHERLSGYPSSGGYDRKMIAERLAESFPDARILIIIREQRQLIRSMYSQHITDGGVESAKRYLKRPEPGLCRKPSFVRELYEFDRLIETYRKLFGQERVLVLPFEMMKADPERFLAWILDFCGRSLPSMPDASPVNEKRPLLMQAFQRPLNMLFYHNELSPGALLHIPRLHKRYARFQRLFSALSPKVLERSLEKRLKRLVDEVTGDFYRASNARTQALTGLDLKQFGYDLP